MFYTGDDFDGKAADTPDLKEVALRVDPNAGVIVPVDSLDERLAWIDLVSWLYGPIDRLYIVGHGYLGNQEIGGDFIDPCSMAIIGDYMDYNGIVCLTGCSVAARGGLLIPAIMLLEDVTVVGSTGRVATPTGESEASWVVGPGDDPSALSILGLKAIGGKPSTKKKK